MADEACDLFNLLSDEVVSKVLSLLTEDELCQAHHVCRRWWNLTQDPPLFRSRAERLREAQADLTAAKAQAERQLDALTEAVVAEYQNESPSIAGIIQNRMEEKARALTQKAASFQIDHLIDQVIATYPTLSETRRYHFQERQAILSKLVREVTNFNTYLLVNADVREMEENPFVPTPYRTELLRSVASLARLLNISDESLQAATLKDGAQYADPILSW